MQIVRFERPGDERIRTGFLVDDRIHAIEEDIEPIEILCRDQAERDQICDMAVAAPGIDLDAVILRRPIDEPRRILAAAANYRAPGGERLRPPATPWFFMKWADRVLGSDEAIPLPAYADMCVQEIELAAVIGRGGHNIATADALDHVVGYTIVNDVSARSLTVPATRRPGAYTGFMDWLNGKWFDGFLTMGPCLTAADAVDPSALRVVATINGEVCLDGSTADMHFDVAELVAYVSRFMELRPGDVIATGMPHIPGDEVRLNVGDVIEGTIDGLGTLRNPIILGS